MRWLALLLTVTIAGCSSVSLPSGTSGSGGGTTSEPACSATSTCSDCVTCALNGPCASLYTACEQDASCSGLDQCYAICGNDKTCQGECDSANLGGVTAYRAVTQCVYCQQCSSECAGQCH
ncbi:MAG: hypothetical protein QM820_63475 [Minicystis sp.]